MFEGFCIILNKNCLSFELSEQISKNLQKIQI